MDNNELYTEESWCKYDFSSSKIFTSVIYYTVE